MTEQWKEIDLNCDLGEGIADDEQIIPLISSCNLACGGHAGDLHGLVHLLSICRSHGVRAGAHPSYPDQQYFGRRSLSLSPVELKETILEQLALFQEAANRAGAPMHHIKAHGALYNDVSWDLGRIEIYLGILEPFKGRSKLYAPCRSPLVEQARKAGFLVMEEGFADRAYHLDGRLVSRALEGSLISDPEQVWAQVREMVLNRRVRAREGEFLPLSPDTLCLHGDTPRSLEILVYIRHQLSRNHIRLSK